jgi:hypothetical protein
MGWFGTSPVDNFTIFVERAVMAPNISKIDPDCYPNLGASPWYFRDEVLRMPFHPHSLSLSRATVSSQFSETSGAPSEFANSHHEARPHNAA